jgi:hypothetical protein
VADAASTKDAAIKADSRMITFRCERNREVREQVETIRDSRGDQIGSLRIAMYHTPTRACSLAIVLRQQLQHVVSCGGLAQARKDLLDAMTVRIGVHICHRVHEQRDVISVM